MLQQSLALFIIIVFLARLILQKQKRQISGTEFLLWLFFWIFAAIFIIFIKYFDSLVARLGFSGRGIDILIYLAVALLFYFVIKMRLKIEKIDRDITTIVREISYIKEKKDES